FMSAPRPIVPHHDRPVAYLGGVGMAFGIAAGLVTLRWLGGGLPTSWWVAAASYLVLGLADDIMVFRPLVKFALQALVAALAVTTGVGSSMTGMRLLDAALSWLWIVTLVNAFNLTDVCDGLLGSLGVVMFLALAMLASIFLGDAGSHLLGFLAAAFTLAAIPRSVHAMPMMAACALVVGVPLFETVFVVGVRMRKGIAWWKGSPDHFSLRLQAAGFTRGRAVLVACGVAAGWTLCAIVIPLLDPTRIASLLVGVALSAGAAAAFLLRHQVVLQASRPSSSPRILDDPRPVSTERIESPHPRKEFAS
ncbi:MAG: undecaprenyl/decaprenyl-phosphate alpha-N-acetylglucosaminyl 1-phosphate transferase, partial [Candidatus Eisenbacteria bacterium]